MNARLQFGFIIILHIWFEKNIFIVTAYTEDENELMFQVIFHCTHNLYKKGRRYKGKQKLQVEKDKSTPWTINNFD